MSQYLIPLKNLFESYKIWVSENPQTVGDLETTAKWVSYFVAGRISNSSIVTELIYSLSNILVLFNDRIIEKSQTLTPVTDGIVYQIKLMLTTLEYCEVFIEISAKKLWGQRGRWFFVVVVQVLKTIGRFFLLKQSSETTIRAPPIPVLDRKKIQDQQANDTQNNPLSNLDSSCTFKLKRSGRIIRKIEGAPPFHHRTFLPVTIQENPTTNASAGVLQSAECLYIAKPLLHLCAIGLFGYRSWKSYSIAMLMDLASIKMYYKNRHLLTSKQKVELSKRCVNLLLYLVRSPFYEKTTEKRLQIFLNGIGNKIPFGKTICNPVAQYIPQWQGTYFYMWSN